MKLFIILGNQLFNPYFLKNHKDHVFFMSEDYELCTFEKHHKHKILLFLSSMRSYRDELKAKNFKIIYNDINTKFKTPYIKKLEIAIKEKKIKEVRFFEIENKFFEKKIIQTLNKLDVKTNEIYSPMFLPTTNEFKKYLSKK